eukprot:1072647-Heterocapsa_arctica.AAC.1
MHPPRTRSPRMLARTMSHSRIPARSLNARYGVDTLDLPDESPEGEMSEATASLLSPVQVTGRDPQTGYFAP